MPGILTASFALGVTSAFFSPAFSSIFKDILTPEQRISGNSLRGMSSNAVRLVSPAIGGFVYGLGGATLGFGLDSLSFLVAASAVALANVPRRKMQMQGTILGDMRDGVSYIARTNWLRSIVLVSLLINVFCVAPVELLLALSRQRRPPQFSVPRYVAVVSSSLCRRYGLDDRKTRKTNTRGFRILSTDWRDGRWGFRHGGSCLYLGLAVRGHGLDRNRVWVQCT